mgnify:CR=1 FL=1
MNNLFLILLFSITTSFSQNLEYVGFVIADSVYMDIHLELTHKKDSVFGITTMNKNTPIESKSHFKGLYNDQLKTYLIKEIDVINSDVYTDSISFCLMDMTLKKNRKKLSGTFVGNYTNGERCSSGEVELGEVEFLTKKIKVVEKKLDKLYTERKIIDISETKTYNFRTDDEKITFKIWDKGKEDGDIISLFANKVALLKNHIVKKKKEKIVFNLSEGENKIVLRSDDVGKYPPNTALLELSTKNTSLQFKYSLEKEEYITFTITKE